MKETALLPILLEAGLFLSIAALVIPLLKKLGVPSILGYLTAGIILGPYGLSQLVGPNEILNYFTFENTEHVKLLAEFGIVLLLFVIGLELSPRRLWQMRGLVFGLGSAQVVITGLVIGGIAAAWGNNLQVSILLGASLALSSTAIITQWLHEQKLFATTAGRTSFSILLLQDMAVIPILFLLTIFAAEPGQNLGTSILLALGKMTAAVVIIYFLGQRILRPIFTFANRYGGAEVFTALTLLVIVATAGAAGLAGLSMALGAFLAGLLLAETEFRHEITQVIMPFKSLLLGIFFISFGMTIDLASVVNDPVWLILSAIGLLVIKAVIIYCLVRIWRLNHPVALESSFLLPQAGEFGLLVIGSAVTLGLMAADIGQFMLIVVGLTMLVTPGLTILSRYLGRLAEQKQGEDIHSADDQDLNQHIIMVGYGRMGRLISNTLAQEGLSLIAVDNDARKVKQGIADGTNIFFGDANKRKTLEAAQLASAAGVVVTINSPTETKRVVDMVKKAAPKLRVYVRAADLDRAKLYEKHDNITAIPEHLAISMELAEKVLEHSGLSHDEAHKVAVACAKDAQEKAA